MNYGQPFTTCLSGNQCQNVHKTTLECSRRGIGVVLWASTWASRVQSGTVLHLDALKISPSMCDTKAFFLYSPEEIAPLTAMFFFLVPLFTFFFFFLTQIAQSGEETHNGSFTLDAHTRLETTIFPQQTAMKFVFPPPKIEWTLWRVTTVRSNQAATYDL